MSKKSNNFTIVELLVVISVIAILAAITIGGANLAFTKSQEASIKSRLKAMEMALEEYKRDWGYYPIQKTADTELNFVMESPAPDNKPYLEGRSTQPYRQSKGGIAVRYQYPGSYNTGKYDLWAPGTDEVFDTDGGGDDITNWTQQ